MMYEVKQFKLTSGEEILAEIIEWAEKGEKEIIVKNVLMIDTFFREETLEKYYAFKPYLHNQDGDMDIVLINSDHVIATAIPSEELIESYIHARADGNQHAEQRRQELQKEKELKLKLATEYLVKMLTDKDGNESVDQPSTQNVIQFPNKDDTIH